MNERLEIRPIQQTDNTQIASIIRTVLAEHKADKPGTVYYDPTTDDLFSLFRQPGSAYFIVMLNDEVVGGAGIFPTENLPQGCCELVKLYLHNKLRGKGIGRSLIQRCIDEAKKMGYSSMYLETMPELSNAVSLYEKLGFKSLPQPLGNSGHFGCDIWMLLTL
jgi:putative acetyltransferase